MSSFINLILILGCAVQLQTNELTEALRYFNNKQYPESIKVCTHEINRLLPRDSLYSKFLSLRGSSYAELEEYQLAINDYKSLLKLKPTDISNYTALSFMYGQSGNYEKCDEILSKGLKLNPHDPMILNNLSFYAALSGNYTNAIKYANEGLEYVKDKQFRALLLNNRGYGLINLNKNNDGLVDINNSIKLDPDNSFAYCYRAIANIHLKQWKTVCDDLHKAKKLGAEKLTSDLIKKYCK